MRTRILWRQHPGRARFLGDFGALVYALAPKVWLALVFEPRDLWIGVYWKRPDVGWEHAVDIYVCIVPCLPIVVQLRLSNRAGYWREVREAWWAWRGDRDRAEGVWDYE
jgi:hypothetical protein